MSDHQSKIKLCLNTRVIGKLEYIMHCDHWTNGINLFRSNLNQSVSSSWLADRSESSSSSTASRLSAGCSVNCTVMSQLEISVVLVVPSSSMHVIQCYFLTFKNMLLFQVLKFIYKYIHIYIRKNACLMKIGQVKGRQSQNMWDQNRSDYAKLRLFRLYKIISIVYARL